MKRRIYICPHCYAVSHNPNDVEHRYCARCHQWGMSEAEQHQRVTDIVNQAMPLFAGQEPYIVGAALADLLAIWLAGHMTATADNTRRLRDSLLKMHVGKVRQLVPVNEAAILETRRAAMH